MATGFIHYYVIIFFNFSWILWQLQVSPLSCIQNFWILCSKPCFLLFLFVLIWIARNWHQLRCLLAPIAVSFVYIKTWDCSFIEEFTVFLRDLHYCYVILLAHPYHRELQVWSHSRRRLKNAKFWSILLIISNCEVHEVKFNMAPRKRNDCSLCRSQNRMEAENWRTL